MEEVLQTTFKEKQMIKRVIGKFMSQKNTKRGELLGSANNMDILDEKSDTQ